MLTEPAQAALPAGLSATAFSSLVQAVGGLRNRRAIVALLGCLFAGVIVVGLLAMMSMTIGGFAVVLAALVWVVAIGTGVNAAGLLQMDRARGISQRSTVDALVHGLLCIPKLLALGLLFFAVVLAVFIVIALLLLICKIPFLGPLLFVVVFPASVVVAGVTIFGAALCTFLSAPAVWQGASITRALAQTVAIARNRLIEAVLLLAFVGFLAMAVAFIIFGVLMAGLLPTFGMTIGIVGIAPMGLDSMAGMMQGGGGIGHTVAGAIGAGLLWAIAATLVAQVYLLGLSLVYLRVTEGLDVEPTETALRSGLDDARRRSTELAEKARSAAHRHGAGAAAETAAPTAPMAGPAAGATPFERTPPPVYPEAPGYPPAAPTYNPPPAYQAPPAHQPPPDFSAAASTAPLPPTDDSPDIVLPLDEVEPAPTPAYAAPPAWTPPPVLPPVAAPAPPPLTACPQCLSAVTDADLFCGVCGFRLK
jgi:hypothetical protein